MHFIVIACKCFYNFLFLLVQLVGYIYVFWWDFLLLFFICQKLISASVMYYN